MKPTVFIHTNAQQLLGAKISAYSLQRASANSDKFDVQIVELEKFPHLYNRDGQTFLRDGRKSELPPRRASIVHVAALHAAFADEF